MRKFLYLIFSFFISQQIFAQEYWQQNVDYKIEVSLNEKNKTLQGFETINYTNNSNDTLKYLWVHLWPNAYKNDRTAFSEQLLENGRTDFYFAEDSSLGYINKLDFKSKQSSIKIEDHPLHQDIVKLIFEEPILPKSTIEITTPFQVKIPKYFSRSGISNTQFNITQWYPKIAVYDKEGWHPMPYLDQGEFYSDFGNYEVKIIVPEKYIVAATGELIDSSKENSVKTFHYKQNNIIDFAWFADPNFIHQKDFIEIDNRKIELNVFYHENEKSVWQNAIKYLKRTIEEKSKLIGNYPYNIATVVSNNSSNLAGGMEYPTITLIDPVKDSILLDYLINHEIGHNWFYGILATNERKSPWMDEGMNSYYDQRYLEKYYGASGLDYINSKSTFIKKRTSEDWEKTILQEQDQQHRDQKITTASEDFSEINYGLVAYKKTALWMQTLEKIMGLENFDKAMQDYYSKWKFKHPTREDFKKIMEQYSEKDLNAHFALLDKKGAIDPTPNKSFKAESFISFKNSDKTNYLFFSPAIGYNHYDKLMLGILFHNFTLPSPQFQYFIAPLYGFSSKELNGIGNLNYRIPVGQKDAKLNIGIGLAKFTSDNFKDSTGKINPQPFHKIVPTLTYYFAKKNPRSTVQHSIQFKSFFIEETSLLFTRDTINNVNVISYPKSNYSIQQLEWNYENDRVLYPHKSSVKIEMGKQFYKLGFTGNYFFNYAKGGGMNLRMFAGKFIYKHNSDWLTKYYTDRFHLNMTGPKGNEDYTYSNYFIGRNEFEGLPNQQIMIRDGAFKVRTDLLSDKIGKTDNWLTAFNFTTSIPKFLVPSSISPGKIPIKLFADIGTDDKLWDKNNRSNKILYDAGLQLNLLSDAIQIYFPIIYSKIYKDYFKSTLGEKRFLKTISFSLNFDTKMLQKKLPF